MTFFLFKNPAKAPAYIERDFRSAQRSVGVQIHFSDITGFPKCLA
jgi:hypothetical protein